MPCEPTYERSLRSLAELTPQTAASSSLDTVSVPCSASSPSRRRYTARRATVASGTARLRGPPVPVALASPRAWVPSGPACGGDVTLTHSSDDRDRGGRGAGTPLRLTARRAGC